MWADQTREQTRSTGLACDHAASGVGVAFRRCGGLRASAIGAAIHVTDFDATLLVDGHVEKVEQVAANVGTAVHPDATALHWCIWRDIDGAPGAATIESARDVEVPDPGEGIGRVIARSCRTIKRDRSTTVVAGSGCRIGDVLESKRRPNLVT